MLYCNTAIPNYAILKVVTFSLERITGTGFMKTKRLSTIFKAVVLSKNLAVLKIRKCKISYHTQVCLIITVTTFCSAPYTIMDFK